MCRDIQYNMTMYPNFVNNTKQEEAAADILAYDLLVKGYFFNYF